MEKTKKNILIALKYYVPIKYWNLNDWDIIINREEEVEENVFKYKFSFLTLYFNDELEPLTYGKQYVIDDEVYYDLNKDSNLGAGTYTLLGSVDWYRQFNMGV